MNINPVGHRAAERPLGRSGTPIVFLGGLGLAALLLLAATVVATWADGSDPTDASVFWLLGASLCVCLALGVQTALTIRKMFRARAGGASGARLHLRFVALFSAAAVAPAVIVALFIGGLVSRSVEEWFDKRLQGAVESSAAFARSYVNAATEEIRAEVLPMATDLNGAAEALRVDAEGYQRYLLSQAVLRSFPAAYVIDRDGRQLAAAESESAPAFAPPPKSAFQNADAGDIWLTADVNQDLFRAVYRLDGYANAYLYVTRLADAGILTQLRQAETAVVDYREAERRRARLQQAFTLAYLNAALLVLVAAVRMGLTTATRFSGPVGRLAEAAGRVAGGDLAVRVPAEVERDELDALARAFNRMTAQLEAQRSDLVSARQDAEARSRFIEAVLSGVSAGVIGLSRDGRITVANPTAVSLLGAPVENLIGRKLVEVAPAFADALTAPLGASRRIDLASAVHLLVRRSEEPDGGAVLTFDDVTRLISAQRHEAWKDVARRIAHEIKNPLTPIQLSAERLQRKYGHEIVSDPETFQRCTATILRQVGDIGRMVDEFSSFARMPTPQVARLDLADIAREVVFAQRLSFADTQFEIEGGDEPIWIMGDDRLLSQALTNLLKNAAEAVQARRARDDGAPEVGQVLLRFAVTAECVIVEVIDNGVGLPAQNRDRLLEPYVTTRAKGAGLGLPIVRRVIEDHGGALELDDPPDGAPGALVRLRLPTPAAASPSLETVSQENV